MSKKFQYITAISVVILLMAGVLTINYLRKSGMQADMQTGGELTNQATLNYTDSQNQPRSVQSNTIQLTKISNVIVFGTIYLKISDTVTSPANGAQLELLSYIRTPLQPPITTLTDTNGKFQLTTDATLPAATYILQVSLASYQSYSAGMLVRSSNANIPFTAQLGDGINWKSGPVAKPLLSGMVSTSGGALLGGATIKIAQTKASKVVAKQTSDSKGRFYFFSTLSKGNYILICSKPSYKTYQENIILDPATPLVKNNITLQKLPILKGLVKDSRGRGIKGAIVKIVRTGDQAVTDKNGKFNIYSGKVKSGTKYTVTVSKKKYRTQSKKVIIKLANSTNKITQIKFKLRKK